MRLAIARGHFIVNVDALTYAACLENVASVADHPKYAFEQVDIRDRAALEGVFAKHIPDAVMHLAAESHVDRSIDGPANFIETNVNGTFNMLEAARSYGGTETGGTVPSSVRMKFLLPVQRECLQLRPMITQPMRPRQVRFGGGMRPMACQLY